MLITGHEARPSNTESQLQNNRVVTTISNDPNGNVPGSSTLSTSDGAHQQSSHNTTDYSNVMPPRSSTGDLVELEPKYTTVNLNAKSKSTSKEKASANDAKPKPSVPQRQKTTGIKKAATSKGLPAYAKVDKSQSKPVKNSDIEAKLSKQKAIQKSKTLPAKPSNASAASPYATIEETLDLKRKSATDESLPAYASIGDTIPSLSATEDAAGQEGAYDLLNPETMQDIIQMSKQQTMSTVTQKEHNDDSNPYDVPVSSLQTYASPNSKLAQTYSVPKTKPPNDPSVSQTYSSPNNLQAQQYSVPNTGSNKPPPVADKPAVKQRAPVGDPYGVTDLSKTDLSHGEREIKEASTPTLVRGLKGAGSVQSTSKEQASAKDDNHLYATLEDPTGQNSE